MTRELDEDRGFIRLNWLIERVGWGCIGIVILAASTGLLGRGPLEERSVSLGPLHLEYDGVMRRSAPSTITVHVAGERTEASATTPAAPAAPTLTLWVTGSLLRQCSPQGVRPPPERTTADSDTSLLTVSVASPHSPATLTIACSPDAVGRIVGAVGIVGGPQLPVRIVVLP